MFRNLKATVRAVSDVIAIGHVRLFREKNALITCLFHGLFQDQDDIRSKLIHPLGGITVDYLRQFVKSFRHHDYAFVAPQDIINGLPDGGKYLMLTFDDGYFNNHRALPVLKEFQVPAVFFISTDHVQKRKCFWWDVLYREGFKRGKDIEAINIETARLKSLTTAEIESRLISDFGEKAFCPLSDLDRPFTPDELKQFSNEEFVIIGNHTCNHAILTNYSDTGMADQIGGCQMALHEMTGIKPSIISYPNGNYSDGVIGQSVDAGLEIGLTVVPRKNVLPLNATTESHMQLSRFIINGDSDSSRQCELIRSDLRLLVAAKNLLGKGY